MTDFLSRFKAISTGAGNTDPHRSTPQSSDTSDPQSGHRVNDEPSSQPLFSGLNETAPQRRSRRSARSTEKSEQSVKPSKPHKPMYQRWWVWVLVGLGAGTTGAVISARNAIQAVERDLPNPSAVMTYVRDGTLTIKAGDGSVLQQLGPATRQKLSFDQIPPMLIQAFVASEDQHFYEHGGVDYKAIARAVFANVAAGEVVEGGSTITQQLARIVFLDQDRSLDRKLREALLAQKMERELSKKQILERYLNLVYLGSGAYGVADAAWIYFSKPVKDLTLPEIAMIAGLPPAPSAYSPLVNLDIAKQRRNIVLARMVEAGFISQTEMDKAIAIPLKLKPSTPRNLYSNTPYFTSYIQQQLPKYVSPEDLEIGGLTVETTLDPKWQQLAQKTVINAIQRYGPGQNFTQAALVSIDPRTGAIKALVGGNDFNQSQFNRATQALRQPGSTFKTFVYTTAVAGGISPYKTYVDDKFIVDGYEPQNYSRKHSGALSMRDALINSVNVIAVKVLIEVGFQPVIDMAKKMGITSELRPTYSLALGASEVNLLELTSAYGTLAAKGNHFEPHGIVRITNRFGEVVYEAKVKPQRAVDADTAAIVTWMLRGVVQSGTGGRAQLSDRPVAGKTGTSEARRDLWFIGYIPQVVTGIWLGNDNNHPTYGASSTAARTWRDFMSQIVVGIPVAQFPGLPNLQGRRGSVDLQPVKPRRVTSQRVRDERDGADDETPNDTERRPQNRDTEPSKPSPSSRPEGLNKPNREAPPPEAPASPDSSQSPPEPQQPAPEPPPPMVVPVEPEPAPPPPAPAAVDTPASPPQ